MLTSVTFAASSQTYANDNNNKKKKRNPFRHKEENFNFFYLVHYCTFLSSLSITRTFSSKYDVVMILFIA